MIAAAVGAIPIAIDIDNSKLEFAKSIGAGYTINAKEVSQVPDCRYIINKRRC
jgi:alcohol dehydrogenase